MDCDSDSELQATDTLRIDSESEDDNPTQHQIGTEPSNGDNISKSNMTDEDVKESSISQAVLENTNPEANQNDIEDRMPGQQHRRSKVSKIVDSDSEDEKLDMSTVEPVKTPTEATNLDAMNRSSSLLDSDSNSDHNGTPIRKTKQTKKLKKKKGIKNGGIVKRGEDLEDELQTSKVITSKKEVKMKLPNSAAIKRPSSLVTSANDILASLNLFFGDEDEPPVDMKYTHITANSMSEDESNSSRSREPSPIRKRMTGKEAMEDRQIIQSESQRMAREAYIDVPYHRTKAYSLEEFLARKTIRKPDPNRDCLGKSTDLSIKMTPEQLEAFARQLKERELESQEFFKSESESSDEEPTKTVEVDESTAVELKTKKEKADNSLRLEEVEPETQEKEVIPDSCVTPKEQRVDDPMDKIVNQTSEVMEQLISDYNENNPCPKETENESEIKYDLITADPKEAAIAAKKSSLVEKLHLAPCPRLSGSSDMMIDLESGSLQPKELSGADILFQRLAKCSGSARKPRPSKSTISILSTDDGVVKLDTVSLFDKEERPLVAKEPVPGAAFLKLKQALKAKINNDRRAAMQKREEEFAKKREMEKAEMGYDSDEGVEELSDDDDDECEEDEEEEKSDVAGQQKGLLNDEAMEDDDEQNQDAGTSESSVSSEESEISDNEEETSMRKRGRIIKAFEDSDDENDSAQHHKEDAAEETPMLKDLEDNEQTKQTASHQNEQDVEKITLLWKGSEEEEQQDDDLMVLCSGRFATQLPSESTQQEAAQMDALPTQNYTNAEDKERPFATNTLYTQGEECIRDSQLMDLCSGRFETQLSAPLEAAMQADSVTKESSFKDDDLKPSPGATNAGGRRLCLDSSDEEAASSREDVSKRSKKRKKRRRINLSDDEDENSNVDPPINDHSDEEELDEDQVVEQPPESAENEEMERFVDYDSEENEVEVVLSKKDKQKILANFVENEAELSESEWGSADEDEKGLDRYDIEVGDEEQFDQKQLQQELEKIHNRQMLDQDNREVEQLKEFFLEDEENDGVGRVRQFRWKNVEKTFNLDYDKQGNGENNDEGAEASDEENELVWRKLRHERNTLLKEQNIDLTATNLAATSLLNPDASIDAVETNENNQSCGSISVAGKRKITVVKKSVTATAAKDEKSFLISNSNTVQGHKASFLSRDEETLSKLANLVKSNPENEGATTVTAGKARNFVFASLTPANEKSSKRLLDADDEEHATTKKAKTAKKETSKKTILLDALM